MYVHLEVYNSRSNHEPSSYNEQICLIFCEIIKAFPKIDLKMEYILESLRNWKGIGLFMHTMWITPQEYFGV